jgi:hypothetical protein
MLVRGNGVHNERLICKHPSRFAPPRSGLLEPSRALEYASRAVLILKIFRAYLVTRNVLALIVLVLRAQPGTRTRTRKEGDERTNFRP